MAVELTVNPSSEVPLYVQVKNQVRLLIERRQLKPGEQLPTVRELALNLNINANTVARVYADLEREGYLSRRRGVGTFAVDPREGAPPELPVELGGDGAAAQGARLQRAADHRDDG